MVDSIVRNGIRLTIPKEYVSKVGVLVLNILPEKANVKYVELLKDMTVRKQTDIIGFI
jgi:hypothetical protein